MKTPELHGRPCPTSLCGNNMNTDVSIQISRRVSVAEGMSFGDVGPYERLVGKVKFALDPADVSNSNLVDLAGVPTNSKGLVEFSGDLDILKPLDMAKSNRRVIYEVNNRGDKLLLQRMNDTTKEPDPVAVEHYGNGFLMRKGYTVVWSGWQGDLNPLPGLLTADLPEALLDGQAIRGFVRQEFISDQPGPIYSIPLSGEASIRSYPALDLDPSHSTLTVREHEGDPRIPVDPSGWAFELVDSIPSTGQKYATPSNTHCHVKEGFRPGWIYELIYETQGSRVMGLGIVGIRDLISFLKYGQVDADGQPNPLAGYVEKAYSYGASLSARVIRQYVYDGYNADPSGRKVFDAMYSHVSGGGRLFTNARFAQVGRYPRQHEEHQWPSERYPFAYSEVADPYVDGLDSVLKRPTTDPLIMHTHTSSEYWQRHGSLGHTNPGDGSDLTIPDTVRMYAIVSTQHTMTPPPSVLQQEENSATTTPIQRVALMLMDEWATTGTPPPATRLPRRDEETLGFPEEVLRNFPSIPGVTIPAGPSRLPRYDYGPDFDQGIVTKHPPEEIPGQNYPVQVPQIDVDGNEVGGLRVPEIVVPVGTYTGWNVRKAGFGEGDLHSLTGSFIPFARTKEEREASGDPRPSIEERYPTHGDYVEAIRSAAQALVTEGLLLPEDRDRYVAAAQGRDPLDPAVDLKPLVLGR